MSLSCMCDDYDYYYEVVGEYETFNRARRCRCVSCRKMISRGDTVQRFVRHRNPISDIEERIYGDEVPMADKFMCERCGDLFLSLEELGFCINIDDDMRELAREYATEYATA